MPSCETNKLIPLKIHYFLFNAGSAPLMIFGPTIAKQMGYSSFTVGCMYTSLPIVGVFLRTTFGTIADKFRLRKLVFALSVVFCLLSVVSMIFLQTTPLKKKINLLCHNFTFINSCNEQVKSFSVENLEEVTNCEFFCQADSEFIYELCSKWKIMNYCGSSKMLNTLNDFQSIKNNYVPNSKLSTLSTKKTMPAVSYDRSITFKSLLLKKHIFTLEPNCIYGILKKIMLPTGQNILEPSCEIDRNISCTVKCNSDALTNVLDNYPDSNNDLYKFEFWVLFLIYLLHWTGVVVCNTMSDTTCIELLGDEPHNYGKQRMFGCIGFGISTLASGRLIDIFSENSYYKDYSTLFHFVSVILILDLITVYFIKVKQQSVSISIFKDVKVLFYNARTIIFAIWCLLTGILCAIVWNFLYWYLEDISTIEDVKWSKTLQGLDTFITTFVGELPFFFISGWIIKKLGHINTMSLILFASMLRFFLYSILTKPMWVLPIEVINGFAFSLCYAITVSYSSLITIPGTESTVQALFTALFDGFGVALGSFLGGLIKDAYGGKELFAFFGFVSFAGFVFHVIIQHVLKSSIPVYDECKIKDSSACYSSPTDEIKILQRS